MIQQQRSSPRGEVDPGGGTTSIGFVVGFRPFRSSDFTIQAAHSCCCCCAHRHRLLVRVYNTSRPHQALDYRRGRWMDNVFIERLWRALKHEHIYLKGYADGRESLHQ